MNTWKFLLSNRQGVGPVWAISVSLVYIVSLVWAFSQSDKLNLTFCLKFSQLLEFCFPFLWLNQTQIYPSSISPLGLFQGIICDTGGLNLITGAPKLEGELIWPFYKNKDFWWIKHVWSIKGSSATENSMASVEVWWWWHQKNFLDISRSSLYFQSAVVL